MSSCRPPVLSRFSLPSKELLIMYLNRTNNRDLNKDQVSFGTPILLEGDGKTKVTLRFAVGTGWEQTQEDLVYFRTEFSKQRGCDRLTIHSEHNDHQGILDDVFAHYGLLLEPNLIELNPMGEMDVDGVIDYQVVFKDHLIFFGSFILQVRPCITFLGNTLGQLMDLREFYQDGNRDRVPVDLYCPRGELLLDESVIAQHTVRSTFELKLYSVLVNTPITDPIPVIEVLEVMTGDSWVCVDEPAPFNLKGSVIIHNGLRSEQYHVQSPAYGYAMVIEIGDLCSNLQGLITIGYQYSQPFQTGNLLGNPAAPNAILHSR